MKHPVSEVFTSTGLPPIKRPRLGYAETKLIEKFIKGRIAGTYRSCRAGAIALAKEAGKPTVSEESNRDRLRRKFSKAWKEYLSTLQSKE
jgi:hypothetical protein